MYTFSPDIAVRLNLFGAMTDPSGMAWASKLRLVLSVLEVRLSLARVSSARAAGMCSCTPFFRSGVWGMLSRRLSALIGRPGVYRRSSGRARCCSGASAAHLQSEGGLLA